jgi:quinol monooxygenase YgiN
MPAVPWTNARVPDPDTEYVVMSSRLPLRHYRDILRFLRDAQAIRRQLRTTPGLVGYALDADIFRKTFWTLSAWRDDASLQAFVQSEPHRAVMTRIHPLMNQPAFAFDRVPGRELPPKWAFAREALRTDAEQT